MIIDFKSMLLFFTGQTPYVRDTEDEVNEPVIRRKSPRKKTSLPTPVIPEPPSTPVLARQASPALLPTLFSTPLTHQVNKDKDMAIEES